MKDVKDWFIYGLVFISVILAGMLFGVVDKCGTQLANPRTAIIFDNSNEEIRTYDGTVFVYEDCVKIEDAKLISVEDCSEMIE